jgi:hypothetical protein
MSNRKGANAALEAVTSDSEHGDKGYTMPREQNTQESDMPTTSVGMAPFLQSFATGITSLRP